MIRRIFAALMLAVLLCSGAYGATWIEGALQSTKDFFTDDIPSFFTRSAEYIAEWWNNSDSKRLERIEAKLDSLLALLNAENVGAISASQQTEIPERSPSTGSSKSNLDSWEADLKAREAKLKEDKRTLNEQKQGIEAWSKQKQDELAEKERELAEQKRILDERERNLESQDAAAKKEWDSKYAELKIWEDAITSQKIKVSEDLASIDKFQSRQRELAHKAANILARLNEDEHTRKFLQAGMLAKMDTVKFMTADKSYGALDIRNTPYGDLTMNLDTDKFGFINPASLKNALKTLFRDNTFSLRGDSVVLVISGDKSDWNKQIDSISGNAFFTIDGLSSELDGLTHSTNTAESEIASFLMLNDINGILRVFFRTKHEGLYVLAVMENESSKPAVYLTADGSHKLINIKDLPRALRNSTELRSSGKEATLYFDPKDSKIDVYLDKFINGLVRKIPGYKD